MEIKRKKQTINKQKTTNSGGHIDLTKIIIIKTTTRTTTWYIDVDGYES